MAIRNRRSNRLSWVDAFEDGARVTRCLNCQLRRARRPVVELSNWRSRRRGSGRRGWTCRHRCRRQLRRARESFLCCFPIAMRGLIHDSLQSAEELLRWADPAARRTCIPRKETVRLVRRRGREGSGPFRIGGFDYLRRGQIGSFQAQAGASPSSTPPIQTTMGERPRKLCM